MNNEYLAELDGVTKRFGKIVALDGIELNVRAGEVLTVLGPNGSGKTTTAISLFLGLQRPDSGAARLFGQSPCLLETRRGIGVMMQEVALAPELRIREHIDLIGSYYPDPLPIETVIEMAGISAFSNRSYGKLSGGQKRQAQFALAICGRPKLFFLDEPTVGLDIQAREKMWATLHKLVDEGCSILLTTHYLQEAEALAHRVAVLNQGRVIALGTVNEIRELVSRRRITCSTILATQDVQSWPEVESVVRNQHGLQITATQAEAVVRRLLAADGKLQDLEISRAGLAEAFTALTKEAAS